MQKRSLKYWLLGAGMIIFTLSSCVSSRKYVDARLHISDLRQDSANLARSLQNSNASLKDCNDTAAALRQHIGNLNDKLNQVIAAAKSQIESQSNQLSSSQQTISQQQEKLAALESILQKQKEAVDHLHKTIADALGKFKSDELTVYDKNGKVYVSMQEKLLFKTASAVVDPQGKSALGILAQVLNANPGISIEVEGHTDSVAIHGKYEDNWALSLARAASVVRILTNDYKVNPQNIIASGHSKYDPVDTNSTPDGRARNRRTDIIIEPDLNELYQLINQEQGTAPVDSSKT